MSPGAPRPNPAAEPEIEGYLTLSQQTVFYRLYRGSRPAARRLLLLHGGGVDGKLTWEETIRRLRHWSEILVPDLRGTGKTHYPDRREHSFEAGEVVADLRGLLDSLGWNRFDLGGYSYGGLVAMLLKAARPDAVEKTYLLEPGLLGGSDEEALLERREALLHAAHKLRKESELEDGLRIFLDAVSPTRSRSSTNEAIALARLAQRPGGLACILECVTRAAKTLDRANLIAAQAQVSGLVGERSGPELYAFCREIAATRSDWRCHLIPGADHALPFQKPEAIAAVMNAELEAYLALNS